MFNVDLILQEAEEDIKNDLDKGRKIAGLSLMLAKAFEKNDKEKIQRLFKALKYNVHEKALPNNAFVYFGSLIKDIENYLTLVGKKQGGGHLNSEETARLPNLNKERASIIKKLNELPYSHKLMSSDLAPDINTNTDISDEHYNMLKKQADDSEKIKKAKEEGKEVVKSNEISSTERAAREETYNIKTLAKEPIDGCTSIVSYVKKLAADGVKQEGQIAIVFRGAGSKNPRYSNPIVIINGSYYSVSHGALFQNAKGGVATKSSPYSGYFTTATNDPKYKEFRDFINGQEDQIKENYFAY